MIHMTDQRPRDRVERVHQISEALACIIITILSALVFIWAATGSNCA
jgi:hypothetical protein